MKQIKLQLLKKKAFHIISFVFGAFLFLNLGCKSTTTITSNAELIHINSSLNDEVLAQKMIQPYKESLDAEMNEVIVTSAIEFPKEKDKPETLLGNFVADLSFSTGINLYNTKNEQNIHMCLLNFGGLRTSLPKGKITKGKIFELMPFDNELVVVTISDDKLEELYLYLGKNPQPISGFFKLSYSEKGYKIYFDTEADACPEGGDIKPVVNYGNKILTSDYLANGGDNMTFFLDPINYEKVGIKLRDAIIEHCKAEHKKGKKITSALDERIYFTK